MVDSSRGASPTVRGLFDAARATDGTVTTQEAERIFERLICDGVTDQEISDARTLLTDLRANPPDGVLSGVDGSDARHSETVSAANEILSHLQRWRSIAANPPPAAGTQAEYCAYYRELTRGVDAAGMVNYGAAGLRREITRVAHFVDARFPPGNPHRAAALAGAYQAIAERYFQHIAAETGGNSQAIDYQNTRGHRGNSTAPSWNQIFLARNGNDEFVTDCKGFAEVANLFFSEAGERLHYMDVGPDRNNALAHRIGYVDVGGQAIAISNDDAQVLAGHSDAAMLAFATDVAGSRERNMVYSVVGSRHAGTAPRRR